MMQTKRPISPYKRGADDGFPFGLLLSAIFLASFYSLDNPGLGLVTLILALAVPFVTFIFLKRAYTADGGATLLSALWMQGIVMFFCGSLIAGAVAAIFFKLVDPAWMTRALEQAIDAYSSMDTPQADDTANMLQAIVDNHLVPPAIQIVFQTIWLGVLSGSVLSFLTALVVRSRRPRPNPNK